MVKYIFFFIFFFLVSCSNNRDFLLKKNTYDNLPFKEFNILKISTTPIIYCGANINFVDTVDSIFFSDCKNKIFSFDKSSKILKTYKLPFTIPYGINVNQRNAYFVDDNNSLISYDLDNSKFIWKIELNAQVKSVPQILNDQIFLNSIDGSVFSHEVSSGKSIWIYNSIQSSLSLNLIRHSAVSNKKSLLTSFPGGKVVSLNIENGLEQWSNFASFPEGDNDIERLVDFKFKPIIFDDFACFSVYYKNIICFDITKGTKIFEFNDEPVVFFNNHDNYLIGVSRKENLFFVDTFESFSLKVLAINDEVIHSAKIKNNVCLITINFQLICIDPKSMDKFHPSFSKNKNYKNIFFSNNFLFLQSKNNKISIHSVSQ